jgi:hypothetical protein
MKESSSLRPYFKDGKTLLVGIIIGSLTASLLWLAGTNIQASLFKKWHDKKFKATEVQSVIETGEITQPLDVIETGE